MLISGFVCLQLDDRQLDAIHLHVARHMGIVGLGSALISLQAGGFLHEHDKRHQFVVRFVVRFFPSWLLSLRKENWRGFVILVRDSSPSC